MEYANQGVRHRVLVREPNVRFAVFCAVTAPQSRLVPCRGPVCSRRWTRWRSLDCLPES